MIQMNEFTKQFLRHRKKKKQNYVYQKRRRRGE